ncbi:MAG: electron transfer flavoprotein subunit alpha [Candidatus Sumerlaeia bacterium]|nr:electron transfer flavoprotein subunit alpha [Candidatus Sumerlaeia bacterium]
MEKILVVGFVEGDGSAGRGLLEAVGAARELSAALGGAAFEIGLVGEQVAPAANALAGAGAVRILGASGSDFAQPRYATDAAAAEALARASAATLIVGTGTSRWARVAAGMAHRLGGQVDTHVTGLAVESGAVQATRWYYRQRMMGRLSRTARPWVVSLDPGTVAPWSGAAGTATVESVAVALDDSARRTQVTGVRTPDAGGGSTIRPEADVLFVAGAGWTKKQADGQPHPERAQELILDFVAKAKASLGSSKSLVDQKGEGQAVLTCLSHLNQVGQTGSTPRHPKGLATCCHGEEPHVVGWRFINERRAVNLDANCGWAQGKADVLYVADAFAVMEKVNALLTK